MMKRMLFALGMLATSFAASARISSEECSPCSIGETRQLAIDQGTGDHFFFDMINRRLTHWAVNLNAGRVTITNVPLTDGQQRIYAATQNFYDTVGSLTVYGDQPISVSAPASLMFALPRSASRVAPMSSSGEVTAFDVVEIPVAKQAVLDRLTSPATFSGIANIARIAAAVVINAFTNNAIINVPIHVYNRAILSDGSSIIAMWNFQTMEYNYIPGSAKDAVGNPIPEDATMAAGGPNSTQRYLFPNTSEGHLSGASQVQHMNNLGIGVRVVTRTSRWTIACVNSFGRTTCTAVLAQ